MRIGESLALGIKINDRLSPSEPASRGPIAVAGAILIYITLERVQARSARQATSELGTFAIGAQRYPRLQLWSIEELLDDREPHLPDMADPYTGERIRQAELFG